jgi:hypothetical protein
MTQPRPSGTGTGGIKWSMHHHYGVDDPVHPTPAGDVGGSVAVIAVIPR